MILLILFVQRVRANVQNERLNPEYQMHTVPPYTVKNDHGRLVILVKSANREEIIVIIIMMKDKVRTTIHILPSYFYHYKNTFNIACGF